MLFSFKWEISVYSIYTLYPLYNLDWFKKLNYIKTFYIFFFCLSDLEQKTGVRQGLLEIIFIGQIVNDSQISYYLRPGNKRHFWDPPYMCTSEIHFGHFVSREFRIFKNREANSLLGKSAWCARQNALRAQLFSIKFTVIRFFSAEAL